MALLYLIPLLLVSLLALLRRAIPIACAASSGYFSFATTHDLLATCTIAICVLLVGAAVLDRAIVSDRRWVRVAARVFESIAAVAVAIALIFVLAPHQHRDVVWGMTLVAAGIAAALVVGRRQEMLA